MPLAAHDLNRARQPHPSALPALLHIYMVEKIRYIGLYIFTESDSRVAPEPPVYLYAGAAANRTHSPCGTAGFVAPEVAAPAPDEP